MEFHSVDVMQLVKQHKPSGAVSEEWIKVSECEVALFDQSAQNQLTNGASGVRVKQYDYLGLTDNKALTAHDYRIKLNSQTFDVLGVNNMGRLAQLFMKVIV